MVFFLGPKLSGQKLKKNVFFRCNIVKMKFKRMNSSIRLNRKYSQLTNGKSNGFLIFTSLFIHQNKFIHGSAKNGGRC
jgi:hypothetical protein